jgi:hypothetical protein
MLLEALSGGERDHDRAALVLRLEDLGAMGLDIQARDVPAAHPSSRSFGDATLS